jgi:hypothetical protein
MIDYLAHIGRVACVTGLVAFLSACVVFPTSTSSDPIPDIVPHLPEDLRNSDVEEVMLIMQVEKWRGKGRIVSRTIPAPLFVKVKDLRSLGKTLKAQSRSTMFFVGLNPYTFFYAGPGDEETERLVNLCVIVSDGRTIALSPSGSKWNVRSHAQLSTVRRDHVMTALRMNEGSSFQNVDGPCGVYGDMDWTKDERAQVMRFLERLPPYELLKADHPLAQIMSGGRTAGAGAGGVMLLASIDWRNVGYVEPPIFLSTNDFQVVRDFMLASKDRDLSPYFPSSTALSRGAKNLRMEQLCAVSSDGRVVWWSHKSGEWKGPIEHPVYREGGEDIVAAPFGKQRTNNLAGECVRYEANNWSEQEKQSSVAFLKGLPERPRTLAETQARAVISSSEIANPSTLDFMLLVVVNTARRNPAVVPILLQGDLLSFVQAAETLTPRDFMISLPVSPATRPRPEYLELYSVCFIGADGRIIELEQEKAAAWKAPRHSRASAGFRKDAINAVREDKRDYLGSYVCSLQISSDWPTDTRSKVIGFLEKIPVEEAGSAKR